MQSGKARPRSTQLKHISSRAEVSEIYPAVRFDQRPFAVYPFHLVHIFRTLRGSKAQRRKIDTESRFIVRQYDGFGMKYTILQSILGAALHFPVVDLEARQVHF